MYLCHILFILGPYSVPKVEALTLVFHQVKVVHHLATDCHIVRARGLEKVFS